MSAVRLPALARSQETRLAFVSSVLLATVLGSAAVALADSSGSRHSSAPATTTKAAAVRAVDFVAPQPLEITFAKPQPPSRPTRVAPPARIAAPAPRRWAPAVSDLCAGTGWPQRRGQAALTSLLHPTPIDVSIAFLPGGGELKGMTYYDRHHVDVFVGSCARESDALLRHVVAHEMGHAWDSLHMTDALRADYLAARGIPAGTPWFGCNTCQDFGTPAGDFAETYAQWQRESSDSRSRLALPASAAQLAELGLRFFS